MANFISGEFIDKIDLSLVFLRFSLKELEDRYSGTSVEILSSAALRPRHAVFHDYAICSRTKEIEEQAIALSTLVALDGKSILS